MPFDELGNGMPVRYWQVAVGKLLGVCGVLVAAIAATIVCPLVVASMGNPDAGPIVTGYIGLLLVGVGFLSLGLALSATTPNPLVAAAGTAAVLVALWLAGVLAGGLGGRPHVVLEYLSPTSHVTYISPTGRQYGFVSSGGSWVADGSSYFLSATLTQSSGNWLLTFPDQSVYAGQERRQRLARPGRRGNQGRVSRQNVGPALLLRLCGSAESLNKPLAN